MLARRPGRVRSEGNRSRSFACERASQPRMRRSLPVINEKPPPTPSTCVEIPIPCEVPWDGMPGDEQVRHCGQCKQNVYNVAAFTRAEAMRLLRRARLPAHLPPPRQHRDHVRLPRAPARRPQARAAGVRGRAAGGAVGADLRAVRRHDGPQAADRRRRHDGRAGADRDAGPDRADRSDRRRRQRRGDGRAAASCSRGPRCSKAVGAAQAAPDGTRQAASRAARWARS